MTKKIKKTTITTIEEFVNNKTQIICILDASSSMKTILDEARDGFNKFVADQKELDGNATLTVVTFSSGGRDNGYNLLFNNKPIDQVEAITENEWYGNGMTALYDAIGKTITDVVDSHKKMSDNEKPDRVMVAIVTDGHENASREFNVVTIKSLISKMEKQDWEFLYLAADQDATLAGSIIGISKGNTLSYTNTGKGNKVMFDSLSNATTMYRNYDSNVDTSNLMFNVTGGKGIILDQDEE